MDSLGTSFTGEQMNKRYVDRFGVRYSVRARHGDRHQCMVSIDRKVHSVAVFVRSDLNECEMAAAESVQLCQGECLNLYPGYRCSNDSYSMPCEDFKADGWTCLGEERRLYPPTSVELDGVGTCELSANEGHSFCPLGVMDCIDTPFGPKCRSELQPPSDDVSDLLGPAEIQDGKGTIDVGLLLRKASTDKNLTYLVRNSAGLLFKDPDQWINTFSRITSNSLQAPNSLFEAREDVSSENLLQSVDMLLNLHRERMVALESQHSPAPYPATSTPAKPSQPRSISASLVLRSASALLNVFSALSPEQDGPEVDKQVAEEFVIHRSGLELRRIRASQEPNQLLNDSIVVTSFSNTSDLGTALVVTIPAKKLEPFLKRSNLTGGVNASLSGSLPAEADFANLDSDVYIIHSSKLISHFRLRMASKEEHQLDVTCRIWDMLNYQDNSFASHNCQTHWIGGKYYECRCVPTRSGTFAVGLVYIMSSKDLKDLKNYGASITIVNYVCSVVTVIALSLFLFFTR
uniref:EGF-like domain-containing protein n=1 Tax=Mesocestoides corti TaxID=53468 RepID=A0A5K3FKG5_MESCO